MVWGSHFSIKGKIKEIYIKVNMKMENNKDMVFIFLIVEATMKDSLKMGK